MTKKVIIAEGQTMYDICLLHYGNLDNILDLLLYNGLTFNINLIAGQVIQLPNTIQVKQDVLDVYANKGIDINTGVTGFTQGDYEARDYDSKDFKTN